MLKIKTTMPKFKTTMIKIVYFVLITHKLLNIFLQQNSVLQDKIIRDSTCCQQEVDMRQEGDSNLNMGFVILLVFTVGLYVP